MNIYKVYRTDYHYKDAEDYESFICVAESEENARMMHPEDFPIRVDDHGLFTETGTASWNGQIKRSLAMSKWARKPKYVSVELIGEVVNNNYEVEQVILASKEQQ